VSARVWRAQVGRVSVYLLDTNCPENTQSDRDITHRLYGGDESVRIRQEMILGIGGVRVLRALGLAPAVWHINEGHAAFLILELLREGIARGLDFDAALEAAAAASACSRRTRRWPPATMCSRRAVQQLLQAITCANRRGAERVAALGRGRAHGYGFNMTRLALAARAASTA
jgi:starch phosphorylase